MLDPNVVKEVKRLLALNTLSQKKIAARTRISRGSVSAIASGKRKLKTCHLPNRFGRCDLGDGSDFVYPTGPIDRCPICGAKVRMPCLACQIASYRQS